MTRFVVVTAVAFVASCNSPSPSGEQTVAAHVTPASTAAETELSCEHTSFVPKDVVDPDMAKVCGACATSAPEGVTLTSQPGVKEGDYTKCPVSGVTFLVEEHRPSVAHDGKSYRFCCAGCSKKFAENPTRFLREECAPKS